MRVTEYSHWETNTAPGIEPRADGESQLEVYICNSRQRETSALQNTHTVESLLKLTLPEALVPLLM